MWKSVYGEALLEKRLALHQIQQEKHSQSSMSLNSIMEQDNVTEETKLDIELNSQAESQKQGEEDFIQWISRLLIENQR